MVTPNYREAFPRLDIRQAQTAYFKNRTVCRYTDESGHCLGVAFIVGVPGETLQLDYHLGGPYFDFQIGPHHFGLVHTPNPVNPHLHLVLCPSCGAPKKILFFKGRWRCADCHNLKFRSQVVPNDVRQYERNSARRDQLRVLLAKGKPHRIRQTSYARMASELRELEEWIKRQPRKVASAAHRHLVTGEWMEPKDVPDGLDHPRYTILGNWIEPVQR